MKIKQSSWDVECSVLSEERMTEEDIIEKADKRKKKVEALCIS